MFRVWCRVCWAYPRSRGGTLVSVLTQATYWGLSPLTRGNPRHTSRAAKAVGPIPAHAGEPANWRSPTTSRWAYPRSRGGTMTLGAISARLGGLSPLTRGNPPILQPGRAKAGPIPAHAGEPARSAGLTTGTGAYPRSRGGTAEFRFDFDPCPGLSPLTRGNRQAMQADTTHKGPIPAHAGEPPPAS